MSYIKRAVCRGCRNAWFKNRKLTGCAYPRNTKFTTEEGHKPCYKFESATAEKEQILIDGLTLQEVSTKLTKEGLRCRDITVRYMFVKLGLCTIDEIRTRIIEKSVGEVASTKYQVTLPDGTPAELTISEMWDIHPHQDTVSFSALSSRVAYGTDLWKPKAVKKRKVAKRRKPKAKPRVKAKPKAKPKKKVKPKKEKKVVPKIKATPKPQIQQTPKPVARPKVFNRNLACYGRNEKRAITSRCKHYWALTETFLLTTDQRPERCLGALETCGNFCGELLEPGKCDMTVVNREEELMPKHLSRMNGGGRDHS